MASDVLDEINNAVLDLQASNYQTFPHPLRRLGRLLRHSDLKPFVDPLLTIANVDDFVRESEQTQGGMVGSATLQWPDDEQQVLSLQLQLVLRFGEDPDALQSFAHTFFYTGNNLTNDLNSIVRQLIIPFARDFKNYVYAGGQRSSQLVLPLSNRVFIVHGHDVEMRETVARFLEKLGFDAVILHERASQGRTIIEKVEANADVGFAVVLLSPDDEGRPKSGGDLENRARQNVLLELGFFIGKLGRERVCSLKRGDVEIPSDFAGVVWESFDHSNWKAALARELEAAGHSINWRAVAA